MGMSFIWPILLVQQGLPRILLIGRIGLPWIRLRGLHLVDHSVSKYFKLYTIVTDVTRASLSNILTEPRYLPLFIRSLICFGCCQV